MSEFDNNILHTNGHKHRWARQLIQESKRIDYYLLFDYNRIMKIDVDWMYNQLVLLGWIPKDSHNKSTLDVTRSILEQNTWVTVFAIRGWVIDRELNSTFPTCFIQRQMRNTCPVQVSHNNVVARWFQLTSHSDKSVLGGRVSFR